jgi:hypothetical protein
MVEHPLACETWQPALAGWITAQLAPDEEEALLAHLGGCATCRAEADSLMSIAAVTLGADTGDRTVIEPPPADLGDRIVARVRRERRARRAMRTALAMSAAAAAVVAVVVMTPDRGVPNVDGEPVVFAHRAPGVEASAVVGPEDSGSLIELHASGLDPDVTYAMWLTPPDGEYADRIAAGTFRPDGDGEVDARLRCALPADEMGRAWATTPEGDIALDTEPD